MTPIRKALVLVGAMAIVAGSGAALFLLRHRGGQSMLLLRIFNPPASERGELTKLLRDESDLRARIGLRPWRVLVRIGGTSPGELVWECVYPSAAELERERGAASSDENLGQLQRTLAQRSGGADESTWQLADGAPPASDEKLIGRNHYFPQPGREAEVLAQRLHASDVRARLSFPRGRIWRRVSGGENSPTVIWDLGSTSAGAGAMRTSEAALVQRQEFQEVMSKMQTLLRLFQMGSFRVAD
jgi:hypothetical protein